jgi:hypothetical protein
MQTSGASEKYDVALAIRETNATMPIAMRINTYIVSSHLFGKPESAKNGLNRSIHRYISTKAH